MEQGRGKKQRGEGREVRRKGGRGRGAHIYPRFDHQPPCGHVHTGGFQCVSSPLFWLCRQLSEHCGDTAGVAHEQRVTVGTPFTHLRVRVRLEG